MLQPHDGLLRWTADLAQEARRNLAGPDQATWITRLQTEHDNIRVALAWALENDPVRGLAVTTPLAQFWFTHNVERESPSVGTTSYLREGADWSQRMLDAAQEAPAELRARALVALGGPLQIRLGEFEAAVANLKAAEALLGPLDLPGSEGWAVHYQGIATWGTVPWHKTVDLFRRALQLFTKAENRRGMLFANLLWGYALVLEGSEVDEGLERVGRFDQMARKSEVPDLVGHAAYGTAIVDLMLGRQGRDVSDRLDEAIRTFDEISNLGCLAHTLQATALYHAETGDLERAARVSASASALRDRLAMVFAPFCGFWPDVKLDTLQPELRETALEEGRSSSYDGAVEYAREGLRAAS